MSGLDSSQSETDKASFEAGGDLPKGSKIEDPAHIPVGSVKHDDAQPPEQGEQ